MSKTLREQALEAEIDLLIRRQGERHAHIDSLQALIRLKDVEIKNKQAELATMRDVDTCDECGAEYPESAGEMEGRWHKTECSLFRGLALAPPASDLDPKIYGPPQG